MKLYRPVGIHELRLVAESGWRAFPPRLEGQPIFYAVLDAAYASQIASDWNTADEASGFAGFVTVFEVADAFVERYEVQVVGGSNHRELWVPAEELAEFNRHIMGGISVLERSYGERFSGAVDPTTGLPADIGCGRLITYLNTDLDVASSEDLTELAATLESLGVSPLNVARDDDGMWRGTFETDDCHDHVESNVEAIVGAIESLPPAQRRTWDACAVRELNVGYDCGSEPWAFQQGLSNGLLARLAAIGASFRITLYPARDPDA